MKAWTDCILDRLVGITATGGRAVAIEVAEGELGVPGGFSGCLSGFDKGVSENWGYLILESL